MIAWLLFNGHSVNTLGGGFGGQLIFDLAVTPALVALGIVWACVIGVIGGLVPGHSSRPAAGGDSPASDISAATRVRIVE